MAKVLTKSAFMGDLARRGWSDADSRAEFRKRFGYFPERVGEEVDLSELEGDKRKLPRDPNTGEVLYGPRVEGVGEQLPEPFKDEVELVEHLRELGRQELETHPRVMGKSVPMRHLLPPGKQQRDVIGFTRLRPVLGERTGFVDHPHSTLTSFREDFESPAEEYVVPAPVGTRFDTRAFADPVRAQGLRSLPDRYEHVLDFPRDLQSSSPIDAKLQRAIARIRVESEPGFEDLPSEVKSSMLRKAEENAGDIDLREEPASRVRRLRATLEEEEDKVAEKIRTKARQLGREQGMPDEESDKVADSYLQRNLESSDKHIASDLWFALSKAHDLVVGQKKVPDIESLLRMATGDVMSSGRSFAWEPEEDGSKEDTGINPRGEYHGEWKAPQVHKQIQGKSFGRYLKWLWSQLSTRAKRRLLSNNALQDIKSIDELDAAFAKSPFIIHPDDIRRMYKNRRWQDRKVRRKYAKQAMMGKPTVLRTRLGPDREAEQKAGAAKADYWDHWRPWDREQIRELDNPSLEQGVQGRVWRRLMDTEESKSFLSRLGHTVLGMGAAAVGLYHGVGEAVYSAALDTGDGRVLRRLLPEEREAARAMLINKNMLSEGNPTDYLSNKQIKHMDNLYAADKTRYYRVKADIEHVISKQIKKDWRDAYVEEADLLVEMIPTAILVTSGAMDLPGQQQRWTKASDFVAKTMSTSYDFWQDAGASMLADLVLFAADPIRHFQAFPIGSTLITITALKTAYTTGKLALTGVQLRQYKKVLARQAKIEEVNEILNEPVTSDGLKRLQSKALRGVVSDAALAGYTKLLESMDPIARVSARIRQKVLSNVLDKADALELEASHLLDTIFRETPEPAIRKVDEAWIQWNKAASAIDPETGTPVGPLGALAEMDDATKLRVLESAYRYLEQANVLTPSVKANAKQARQAVLRELESLYSIQDSANQTGQVIIKNTARDAARGGQYTQVRPWNIAVNIVEGAGRLLDESADSSSIPIRGTVGEIGPRTTSAQAGAKNLAILHTDPQQVINTLRAMLKDRTIWTQLTGEGLTEAQLAKKLKEFGTFGREVPLETIMQIEGLEGAGRIRMNPKYKGMSLSELFDPNIKGKQKSRRAAAFRRYIENAIKDLEEYTYLSDEARARGGLPQALKDKNGNVVKDGIHSKGVWVHRSVNEMLEGGAQKLPWHPGYARELVVDPSSRTGAVLRELVGDLSDVDASSVKSQLVRIAHELGVEGVTGKSTWAELHTKVRLKLEEGKVFVKKKSDFSDVSSLSPGTRQLLTELYKASLEDYKGTIKASGTRPLPLGQGFVAKRMQEIRQLAANASATESVDNALRAAWVEEAHRLGDVAQRRAIQDALKAEASGAIDRLTESLKQSKPPGSLPAAMMPDASGGNGIRAVKDALENVRRERLAKLDERAAAGEFVASERATLNRVYKDIQSRLDKYVDIGWDEATGKYDNRIRDAYGFPRDKPVLVPKAFENQLRLDLNFREQLAGKDAHKLIWDAVMLSRRGQTIYHPIAFQNNIKSNYGLSFFDRGIEPVALSKRMYDARLRHLRWEVTEGIVSETEGIKPYPKEWVDSAEGQAARRKWRALRDSGISYGEANKYAADAVSQELKASTLGGRILSALPGGKYIRQVGKLLEKGYKAGDDLFRGEFADFAYDKSLREMAKSEVGRIYDMRYSHKKTIRLVKVAGNDKLNPAGQWKIRSGKGKGRTLTRDEVERYVARGARFGANERFVDYGDQPNWVGRVRTNHITGIFSAHYTWWHNATPRPGTWGIPGTVFKDPVRAFSNSPAVLADRLPGRMKQLTKAVFLSGMEAQQADDNKTFMRMAHQYDPLATSGATLFGLLANPMLMGVDSIENMNFAAPAATLVQTLGALSDATIGDREYPGILEFMAKGKLKELGYSSNTWGNLTDKEKVRLNKKMKDMQSAIMASRSGRGLEGAADLIGLGGGNIVEMLQPAWDMSLSTDMKSIWDRMFPILVTGAGKAAIDTVSSVAWPTGPVTKMSQQLDKPDEEQIKGLTYLMETWTGMILKPDYIPYKVDKAANRLAEYWEDALLPKRLKKKFKDAERIARDPNDPNQVKNILYLKWKAEVKGAVAMMRDRFRDNYTAAKKRYGYMVSGLKGATPVIGPQDLTADELKIFRKRTGGYDTDLRMYRPGTAEEARRRERTR